MNRREGMETKLGILVQIAGQYRAGRIPLKEAMERVHGEMANIRPAQYEAIKKLFPDFLSLPYEIPQTGHPLNSYCEENRQVRATLLKVDEMEGGEATVAEWSQLYKRLGDYSAHLERMETEFYPVLIRKDMRLSAEKAKELAAMIRRETADNLGRLEAGDIVDFLVHQRILVRHFMNYLDLEERILLPKLLEANLGRAHEDAEFKAVDATQNLAELFRLYPKFREDFFLLDEELKGLKGPLGKDLLKDSTIDMLAKSLGMDEKELLHKINKLLESYQ